MQLQKEVKSNPKQPTVKKVCSPKETIVRNSQEMVVLMVKNLMMPIQVNLMPNPSETW